MLNDPRLDFKPPTTRGRTFPTRPTPILSARKPHESEDRHTVDVEHLEVLGRAEIPDLVSGTGDLPRRPSPASSGFRRTQYLASRVVRRRAKVRASTAPGRVPQHVQDGNCEADHRQKNVDARLKALIEFGPWPVLALLCAPFFV